MALAPPMPSSAGWKMKLTWPRKLRVRARYSAAPSSMVVWPSWPQACIRPSWVERCAKVFSSRIGRASMSARSPTEAVSLPSRSTPTTPVPPMPRCTWTPKLSSFSATSSAVRCSSKPSSGWSMQVPPEPRQVFLANGDILDEGHWRKVRQRGGGPWSHRAPRGFKSPRGRAAPGPVCSLSRRRGISARTPADPGAGGTAGEKHTITSNAPAAPGPTGPAAPAPDTRR